ncbi:MAG: 16S rRNA (cytidine(1402)-2'-O)-methyltransferase [Campylobacterota bacterium]
MLTFVPTPIGNLEDISSRSIEALLNANLILCEDTRVTKKLLNLLETKYNVSFENKEFKSFHSHNETSVLKSFDKSTFSKNIVYVSDAGMPCVSDPGASLVQYCLENGINYDVIPGANAVLTAYAMSGFTNTTFTFHGFLPHKGSQRNSKLNTILNSQHLGILYESPHRLIKLLQELSILDENRTIFLVKEISKLYQKSYKDSAKNLYDKLKDKQIKGEWVVVIEPTTYEGDAITYDDINSLKIAPKEKAKLLSKLTGKKTKDIYEELIK